MSDRANNSSDSAELEALFDSIIHATHQAELPETGSTAGTSHAQDAMAPAALQDMAEPARSMFSHIGQMTRKLHDTLRELGLNKSLEKAASQIPDARDRLAYIATMTEQAAERTLNALDIAKPLQDRIAENSRELSAQWDKLFANELSVDEFKALAEKTRAHLAATPDPPRSGQCRSPRAGDGRPRAPATAPGLLQQPAGSGQPAPALPFAGK